MKLLPENELIWSPIVANSRMNRERKASGVNSYEKEFKFKPEIFLETKTKEHGKTSWLDLCCGQGNALIQAALYLDKHQLQQKAILKGIDLLDTFQAIPENINCIEFETASLVNWKSESKYDLITCSHGLHYIGDKLKVIEKVLAILNPQGLFIANLDLNNICIDGNDSSDFLKKHFSENRLEYNNRTKIIRRTGSLKIKFGLEYLGANDQAGPNYTGQEAVNSYYALT